MGSCRWSPTCARDTLGTVGLLVSRWFFDSSIHFLHPPIFLMSSNQTLARRSLCGPSTWRMPSNPSELSLHSLQSKLVRMHGTNIKNSTLVRHHSPISMLPTQHSLCRDIWERRAQGKQAHGLVLQNPRSQSKLHLFPRTTCLASR